MPIPCYIELVVLGNTMKCSAIDPESGVEVCVIAPAHTARADIERLARRKLQWRLERKSAPDGE